MKLLAAILFFDIALSCSAFGDPPPTGDQSQVFSPDEIIAIEAIPSNNEFEIQSLDATGGVMFVSWTNVPLGIVRYPELVVDTNAFEHAAYISSLIANGEIIYYVPPAVSKTTGERLKVSFGKPIPVPAEVLAMPQYEAGAVWRMTYTSAGTNYVLITTVATGFGTPTAEGGR